MGQAVPSSIWPSLTFTTVALILRHIKQMNYATIFAVIFNTIYVFPSLEMIFYRFVVCMKGLKHDLIAVKIVDKKELFWKTMWKMNNLHQLQAISSVSSVLHHHFVIGDNNYLKHFCIIDEEQQWHQNGYFFWEMGEGR